MSYKEIDRHTIIAQILDKKITQKAAAARFKLSERQVKRLVKNVRTQGIQGLISKRRGRPSNNRINPEIKQRALSIICAQYSDFSPTFAHEKLVEEHGFSFSVETLRSWMISENIWQANTRHKASIHQTRERRACFGELIQIDGSPHDWFEGRAPKCTLIVFIDDATGRLMSLKFAPSETTQAYMETLQDYLSEYGRPVSIYSDKHAVFRVNRQDKEEELTQFTRALKTLDIEPIHANTPQAKGRVERANQTLQDRLVKDMRLAKINSLEEGNLFLKQYIDKYNNRFEKPARDRHDAHRSVLHTPAELALIFTLHDTRKLSKNLTFRYKNVEYHLQNYGKGYRLRGSTITICEGFDGKITVLHQGQLLNHKTLQTGEKAIYIEDDKTLDLRVEIIKKEQAKKPLWKPSIDHPWKREIKVKMQQTSS